MDYNEYNKSKFLSYINERKMVGIGEHNMISTQVENKPNKGLYEENWIECQRYLVKKKYSSGSTFLDLDEIGKSTRDLLKDFQQCGCELKSDQMIVLDD